MSSKEKKSKSSQILEEVRLKKEGERIINVDEETVKLVIFTLLEDYFALPGSEAKEILPSSKISYVPGAPEYILGIINVRGDIESVIDINQFMGFPPLKADKRNRIIIAVSQEIRSGILVGSVEDVLDVSIKTINPPLSTLNDQIKPFVKGSTEYKGKNVTILDASKIFDNISVK